MPRNFIYPLSAYVAAQLALMKEAEGQGFTEVPDWREEAQALVRAGQPRSLSEGIWEFLQDSTDFPLPNYNKLLDDLNRLAGVRDELVEKFYDNFGVSKDQAKELIKLRDSLESEDSKRGPVYGTRYTPIRGLEPYQNLWFGYNASKLDNATSSALPPPPTSRSPSGPPTSGPVTKKIRYSPKDNSGGSSSYAKLQHVPSHFTDFLHHHFPPSFRSRYSLVPSSFSRHPSEIMARTYRGHRGRRPGGYFPRSPALLGYGAYRKKKSTTSRKKKPAAKRRTTRRPRLRGRGAYLRGGSMFETSVLPGNMYGPALSNSLIDAKTSPLSVNQAMSDLTGDIYINHREFVSNIFTNQPGGTFNEDLYKFRLNPGLGGTYQSTSGDTPFITDQSGVANPDELRGPFPWLRQIAENFTLYEFEGLVFEYRPMSGEFGQVNSNALGTIIMATEYDPTIKEGFENAQSMLNYDYANSGKPSQQIVHAVETARKQNTVTTQYVAQYEPNPQKDPIFTDLGIFQLAVDGVPTTATPQKIGELWVTYRVKLSRAQIKRTTAAPTPSAP